MKSYFVAELVRAIYQMGRLEFERIKSRTTTGITRAELIICATGFILGYAELKRGSSRPKQKKKLNIPPAVPENAEIRSNEAEALISQDLDSGTQQNDLFVDHGCREENFDRNRTERLLLSDRLFHEAIYEGDFWFMDKVG